MNIISTPRVEIQAASRDLLKQNGASLTFLPSEDVSTWPEQLKMKTERSSGEGREMGVLKIQLLN